MDKLKIIENNGNCTLKWKKEQIEKQSEVMLNFASKSTYNIETGFSLEGSRFSNQDFSTTT